MSSSREIQSILAALGGGEAALATLVGVTGSSYRQPGARCLVLPDGSAIGSISGGCLEEDVRQRARKVLGAGGWPPGGYDTGPGDRPIWGTGLGCQGEVRVLIEKLPFPPPGWIPELRENLRSRRHTDLQVIYQANDPGQLGTRLANGTALPAGAHALSERVAAPPSLIVFGAGDDAIPLVHLARELGWQCTVLDSRPAYGTAERFRDADEVASASIEALAGHPSIDAYSHVIVMTHRYRDDVALLRLLLARRLAYLGMLGPRRRTE